MSDRMPKIDISKLSDREILYIKEVERKNLERVEKFRRMRRNNRITGSLLGLLAISIYGYSMYAVKQETFLDDFEEPQKIIQ